MTVVINHIKRERRGQERKRKDNGTGDIPRMYISA
jgi:hypothetical protein